MTWLYTILKPYCERKGIRLLHDDFKFIERCLSQIHQNLHRSVMRDYVRLYLSWLAEGEKTPQTQNLARRQANNWLREYCFQE